MADLSKYQDINAMGTWPLPGKIVVMVLLVLIILGLNYYFFTSDQIAELKGKERIETNALTEFENKYKKAANLSLYRNQMAEMDDRFKDLLAQLPKNTEIPGLLDEISYAASGSAVELLSHKYLSEKKKEFYFEKPIEIIANGSYHQIADFVSRMSKLPRIVTLHKFSISPAKLESDRVSDEDAPELLTFSVEAKTYRYEPKEEQ